MNEESRQRLARADTLLRLANTLASEFPSDSISRSFYAMFHAATAVLQERDIRRKSHKSLIAAFGEFIVKPGELNEKYHAFLRRAFERRNESDYFVEPHDSEENAQHILKEAQEFVEACRRLIEQ